MIRVHRSVLRNARCASILTKLGLKKEKTGRKQNIFGGWSAPKVKSAPEVFTPKGNTLTRDDMEAAEKARLDVIPARQNQTLPSDIPVLKHNKRVREQLKDSIQHRPPPISNTHLVEHKQMCEEIDALGDRYKYPQEWEDYMDYAVINNVGLTPDNPHILYSESNTAIASCICDPEMPFVHYSYIEENGGDPMTCMCGYFFKLEKVLVAPGMHKLMEIPDDGFFDPRCYNPDDNSYTPRLMHQDGVPKKMNVLKPWEDYVPNSGLGIVEEQVLREQRKEELYNDPEISNFVLDYRQKPDGYLNYSNTELKYNRETDEFEQILVPEDEDALLQLQAQMDEAIESRKQLYAEIDEAEKKRKLKLAEEKLKLEAKKDEPKQSCKDEIIESSKTK